MITGLDVPATPVTMPVAEPMEASVVTELVHVPPDVASLKISVAPTQTCATPLIALGNGLIVIDCTAVVNGPLQVPAVTDQVTTQK